MRRFMHLVVLVAGLASPAAAQVPAAAPAHASFVIPDVRQDQARFFLNLDVERDGAAWVMTGCRSSLEGSCHRTFRRVLTADEGRGYEAHWREMGAMASCRFPALGRMDAMLTVDAGAEHLGRPVPTDATRRDALAARIGGLGRGGDCDSIVRLALYLVSLAPH